MNSYECHSSSILKLMKRILANGTCLYKEDRFYLTLPKVPKRESLVNTF